MLNDLFACLILQASQGRTTIVIAHRLSTIRNADVIVGISEGQLQEQGTHDELMKMQGIYYHLVTSQSAAFKSQEDGKFTLGLLFKTTPTRTCVRSQSITGVKQSQTGLVLDYVTSENVRQALCFLLTQNAVCA